MLLISIYTCPHEQLVLFNRIIGYYNHLLHLTPLPSVGIKNHFNESRVGSINRFFSKNSIGTSTSMFYLLDGYRIFTFIYHHKSMANHVAML